jgi:hypothetical protein
VRAPIRSLGIISFSALTLARPCSAQVRVEVTPLVRAYVPGKDFASVVGTTSDCNPGWCFLGASLHQNSAPIVGAQITTWLGKQFAVEAAGGYSPSSLVTASDCVGMACPTSAAELAVKGSRPKAPPS